jgi:hypothetical protein
LLSRHPWRTERCGFSAFSNSSGELNPWSRSCGRTCSRPLSLCRVFVGSILPFYHLCCFRLLPTLLAFSNVAPRSATSQIERFPRFPLVRAATRTHNCSEKAHLASPTNTHTHASASYGTLPQLGSGITAQISICPPSSSHWCRPRPARHCVYLPGAP